MSRSAWKKARSSASLAQTVLVNPPPSACSSPLSIRPVGAPKFSARMLLLTDLSYGNKKKVGIVQGLLHSPKLLFLDEPTAGLDPLMQRKFFDLIRLENARGATVFFSSHILGEVQRMCSRVGIIREGSIAEISDIRTLQQNNYKKVNVTAVGLNPTLFDLPGVTNLQTEDGVVHFFFKGDINMVLQKINQVQVTDVI